MSGKRIQWFLIGTSALFGSLSTFAILHLISRWSNKKIAVKKTRGLSNNNISICPEHFSEINVTSCNGALNDMSGTDLLNDEVVSEQLTSQLRPWGGLIRAEVIDEGAAIIMTFYFSSELEKNI